MKIFKALLFILICNNAYSQIYNDSVCIVNLNIDTTYQLRNPQLTQDFIKNVLPSLFYVPIEHGRAFGKYYIPFDTIAKVTGMQSLLGNKLIKPCCVCCSGDECAPDVEFIRNGVSEFAKFKIKFKNIGANFFTVDASHYNQLITLKFDTLILGNAIIGPNLIRLQIPESRIFLNILDQATGEVIEDIIISCITITPDRIVYMPRENRPFKGVKLPMIIYKN